MGGSPRQWHRRRPQYASTVRDVALIQVLANGAGALVVFLYLRVLFPVAEAENDGRLGINVAVFAAYLLITLCIGLPLNYLLMKRAIGWVREGREPTDRERWATLTQPLQQTTSAFLGWLGAAIIFGVLNQDATRVSMGIVLAGLLTCALLYLFVERQFRPIFALALAEAELPRPHREILPRLMLAWVVGCAIPLVAVGLAPIGLSDTQRGSLTARIVLLVGGSLVAGGLVMRGAAKAVADPIERVRQAMARIQAGELEVETPVDHAGEIGRLQSGFNSMVDGLRERRRIHDLFGRQVGAEVADAVLERGARLGGEEREITALFIDLNDFTGFTQRHSPAEVVDELNQFFSVVVAAVMLEGGLVNQFEGDAALCVFGAPSELPDHAARALRAAARLPRLIVSLPHAPQVGIGVATGRAIVGNVGTSERFEYTVIGDAVNVASRLTELAKQRADGGSAVLASGETVEAAGAEATTGRWQPAGITRLRGRTGEVELYEPVSPATPNPSRPPQPPATTTKSA